jgi:ABC-type sugar transport system ATPase subunit
MAQINLKNINKSFGDVTIIPKLDLAIKAGEFVVLVGPSGCGKSTLLRMVAGLENATDGTIEIGGEAVNNLEPSKRGIAMVFQSYALYPHMTVRENIGFGLRMANWKKADINQTVEDVAKTLQLYALLERKPKDLSGGQRQRVAIGRAIVRNPKVFLFDEPLSNLDAELRQEMRVEISRLHDELGATMIYVTHDQIEAMTLADKIAVLKSGKVEQFGSPKELFENPDNVFVAQFIGSPKMNLLDAVIINNENGHGELRFTSPISSAITFKNIFDAKPGMKVKVGIRPQHLVLDEMGEQSIKVDVVEAIGTETSLVGTFHDNSAFIINSPDNLSIDRHSIAKFNIDGDRMLLFSEETGVRIR